MRLFILIKRVFVRFIIVALFMTLVLLTSHDCRDSDLIKLSSLVRT